MVPDYGTRVRSVISSQWSWWWGVSNKEDELARAVLTFSIVILSLLWCKWILSKRNKNPPLPPGPRGLPIVGYFPFLGSNLHVNFTELAHRYGPIYKLRLGGKLQVVVSSAALAKIVVKDEDPSFANRDPPIAANVISYGARDIVFANNDVYWRTMRKTLITEVLSRTSLEACQSFRRDQVRKTIKNIYSRIGTKVDINEISFMTELNVVTSMLWGTTLDEGGKMSELEAEFRQVVCRIMELVGTPNISDYFPILARFDLQGVEREAKRLIEHVDRIFEGIVEERIKYNSKKVEKGGRKDFLQILLELKDSPTASLNITQLKAILVDIVVGGTDSTATMAEWAMAEILKNPEIMKKVRDELTQVIGTNIVDESHLPQLKYLDAVIKEAFRLHPPIPLLSPRCPDKSCVVGGYTVPKGTIVFLNVWAIQHDPENWENPMEFKPERFLNLDGTNKWDYFGNNYKFFPFGSGRRTCAGIPLAEKMLMYIVASLLHSFDWSLPEGEELDMSDKFGLVLKKTKPLVAIPSKRLNIDYF